MKARAAACPRAATHTPQQLARAPLARAPLARAPLPHTHLNRPTPLLPLAKCEDRGAGLHVAKKVDGQWVRGNVFSVASAPDWHTKDKTGAAWVLTFAGAKQLVEGEQNLMVFHNDWKREFGRPTI